MLVGKGSVRRSLVTWGVNTTEEDCKLDCGGVRKKEK
jgi:hypothetical protein